MVRVSRPANWVNVDAEVTEDAEDGVLCGERDGRAAIRRASAIAAMWSGVVPQQPPTMFTKPLSANSCR